MTSRSRCQRMTAQDETATPEQLVRRALPLVQYMVSEVAARVPRHVSRDELASAGLLGLAQAAKAWDPSRGVSFEGFARARINGAILDELRGRDWASRSVRAEGRRLRATAEELTTRLGHQPTAKEIAQHLGIEETAVTQVFDDLERATVVSFDNTVNADGANSPVAADESPMDALLSRELRGYLADAIHALPERLRKVVVEYFFEERQMQDIADDLGVTESRVSQMRGEALALLKDGINSQLDPEKVPDLGVTTGRVGKRKSAYYTAIAGASDFRNRVGASAAPAPTSATARSA